MVSADKNLISPQRYERRRGFISLLRLLDQLYVVFESQSLFFFGSDDDSGGRHLVRN
jgi:hypothetical protein